MTGGYDPHFGGVSSTEVLMKGGTSWTLTENSLPEKLKWIGSVSYNNQVFVTGKQNYSLKILLIFHTTHCYKPAAILC